VAKSLYSFEEPQPRASRFPHVSIAQPGRRSALDFAGLPPPHFPEPSHVHWHL